LRRIVAGAQTPAHQHARAFLACLGGMAAQLDTSVEHAAVVAQPAHITEEEIEGKKWLDSC